MTTIDLWTGARITVRNITVEAFRALDTVMKAWNYAPRKQVTGAFNCRKITGGTGFSLHAYGIAADINWDKNPFGPRLVTDMPRGMVEAILAIRTNGGHEVFGWGGNYRRNKDAMHYEIVASPSELATGIQGQTVATPPSSVSAPGTPPFPGELSEGAIGEHVRKMQARLNMHLRGAGKAEIPLGPARFGPKTKAAVLWFQGARNLGDSGVVNEATWNSLWQ